MYTYTISCFAFKEKAWNNGASGLNQFSTFWKVKSGGHEQER